MNHPIPEIDGYSDPREIGSGGFSRVFEALQIEFDRRVAVKVLNARLEDYTSEEAFERECRSMGALSRHPYIVTVLASAFTSDHWPCIVMELFPSGDYMTLMRRGGPIPLAELLPLGIRMASALSTAHEHGVVHGDVKPQNIFKSEFGYPALGDFGIATLGNKLGQDAPTGLSTHYAAPELIEGGAAHTSPAADQYSLGATIYTLATGRRPFESSLQESPQKVLVRALTEPVPPLPSHFPPEFNRVVLCAMARDPQRRYRDLKAFGVALVGIERQLGFQPTSAPLISEVDEEARDVQSHYEFGEELLPRHHEEIDSSVTILRSLPSARPAPETGPQSTGEPDAETGAEAPPSPSRLWIAAAGTVAALVVAIVAFVYSCGGPRTITGDPPSPRPVTPAVPVTPAGVTGLTGTLDGGSATFAWEPSKTASEHEVSYLLTPIGGSASRTIPVEVPSYTIEDVATFKGANEDFCVEVRTVLRSTGRMSPESETATACAQEDVSP